MLEDFRLRNIPLLFVDLSYMNTPINFTTYLRTGGFANAILNVLPDECPYCHHNIAPTVMSSNVATDEKHSVVLLCTKATCREMFIAYYKRSELIEGEGVGVREQRLNFQNTSIGNQKTKTFEKAIKEISPNFIEIYNQAFWAEQYKLLQICGVGYRKALEFLIKDFAKRYNPEEEKVQAIEKDLLAKVIKDYISDENIKYVADRAVWLGNDETHYVRKWEDLDLQDMKKLIDLVLMFITAKFEFEELKISMEKGKK